FGPPVLFYATRIWPEVPAAFCYVEALRGIRNQRAKRWVPAILGLVLLKLRFVLVAMGLLFRSAVAEPPLSDVPKRWLRHRTPKMLIVVAILAVPMAIAYFVSGSATSVHTWRELIPGGNYARGFFGLLADGMSGIAFRAPFYLFGLFALTRWRTMPRGFRDGILASLLYILYLLPRPEWFGGWAPPLRYVVFVMPVLALGAAVVIAVILVVIPRYLGSGIRGPGIFAWTTRLGSRTSDPGPRFSFDLAIPLFALAIAAGFAYARQPASRVEFEDVHVVHKGGELYPELYMVMRVSYRGGWVLEAGDELSFLARAGTWTLHSITGPGALIELAGRAYQLPPTDRYTVTRVTIPKSGRVALRVLSGSVNVDRMDRD